MSNRLAHETSPYLLQHAENPVDWYPWGEEALARARTENRPILLSVGYSACHWCHVMAHESFENPEIAAAMNAGFVCIKVDREERPDLDQIYQNVAQLLTRGGGWPLTVFLTPDLKPFFGGTYFPPEDRWGRPGFPKVLRALSEAFQNEKEAVAENAERLMAGLRAAESVAPSQGRVSAEGLKAAIEDLLTGIDWEAGGMVGAPKFPNPMVYQFLWSWGTGNLPEGERACEAVLVTLDHLARGGIYDHLAGGFHRYSVDATWSVPHFEKMLYDNALLLELYAQVLNTTNVTLSSDRAERYRRTVQGIVAYLRSEMKSPEGLYFSAQDADTEGEEGKTFVWDAREIAAVLGEEMGREFCAEYGVTEQGNFERGKTVLFEAGSRGGEPRIAAARAKLLAARRLRPQPQTDDKILTAWNALLVSGFCAAARTGEASWAEASSLYASLVARVARPEGRLWSHFKGAARQNGYLDDYAFLARAALDLASGEVTAAERGSLREQAAEWMGTVVRHFADEAPGFAFTSDDHEALPLRPRTLFDQAIPSGTAIALRVLEELQALGVQVPGADLNVELERQWKRIGAWPEQQPHGMAALLAAAMFWMRGTETVSGPEAWRACGVGRAVGAVPEGQPDDRLMVCHRGTCRLLTR